MSPLLETFGFASARGWRVPNGALPAYELISTQLIATTTTTITFSSIPTTYKHLQLRYTARGSRASTVDFMGIYFNGDTAANYWYHYLSADGSSVSSSSIISAEVRARIGTIPASTASSNVFGSGVIDVLDYVATTKNKTVRTFNGHTDSASAGHQVALRSGLWNSTAAINSATLVALNAGFLSGSGFSLYGIKG